MRVEIKPLHPNTSMHNLHTVLHIFPMSWLVRQQHSLIWFNPLQPNISVHILHTVLYTFPKVLKGEFVLQSRASLLGDHLMTLAF